MTTGMAKGIACGLAMLAFWSAGSLHAQMEVGTWVREPTASMPGMMMNVEVCCDGGLRLTYHVVIEKTETLLIVESRLDGRDAPVLMDGKPSGETMAIKRVDDHHLTGVVKMNGEVFSTSKSTLSADGRTVTVINDVSSTIGGQPIGTYHEIWIRK